MDLQCPRFRTSDVPSGAGWVFGVFGGEQVVLLEHAMEDLCFFTGSDIHTYAHVYIYIVYICIGTKYNYVYHIFCTKEESSLQC